MRKAFVFLLFVLFPILSYADVQEDYVSVDKNMELLESKIKDNKLKFDNITEEVQKRYPDSDWSRFQELEPDAKRIVIKNLLAQEAFSEIRENYKKDIYARSDGNVSMDDYGDEIYYYNSSDKLYRTNYAYEDIMEEAEQHGLLHETEGAVWKHFKQKDLSELDKIIAKHVEKAPADMLCDKWCAIPRSRFDQDWAKTYLAAWKKELDDYEKAIKKSLENYEKDVKKGYEDYDSKLEEYLENYKKDIKNIDRKDELKNIKKAQYSEQIKDIEKYIKENNLAKQEFEKQYEKEKQDFANKMMQKRKEYDEAVINLTQKKDVWDIDPYRPDCEMVTISCWNVQHIPTKYERYQLSMSKSDDATQEVVYVHDDIEKNEHIESFAFKSCECNNDISDNFKSVTCDCDISFDDFTSDFNRYRNYENQDRIDIKNGKLQDTDEKGHYKHEWAGNLIPGGKIYKRSLDLFGNHDISKANEN